jgi:D-threo-aldose 1-dehydrogenase
MHEKRAKITEIAKKYNTDIVHAALHFVLAADEFASLFPEPADPNKVKDNADGLNTFHSYRFLERTEV